MPPSGASYERQQLEQAIAAQESLRGTVDDAIIDATIATLKKELATPDSHAAQQLGKEMVIAIPGAGLIQGNQKEIVLIQIT